MEKEISNTTILCYIDVLGYSELVRNHHSNKTVISGIENILLSSVRNLKDAKESTPFSNQKDEFVAQQIFNTLRIRFVSDSIIYTLPLSDRQAREGRVSTKYAVHTLFRLISIFCTLFIAKTGHILRGGISIGPHYEHDLEEDGTKCLFIFSKAYVDAVDIEKKSAKTARVVLADDLLRYLKRIGCQLDDYTFKDDDGSICFKIYNHLKPYLSSFEVLGDIKKGITMNIASHIAEANVLEKLIYFARYHNARVKDLSSGAFMIDCSHIL